MSTYSQPKMYLFTSGIHTWPSLLSVSGATFTSSSEVVTLIGYDPTNATPPISPGTYLWSSSNAQFRIVREFFGNTIILDEAFTVDVAVAEDLDYVPQAKSEIVSFCVYAKNGTAQIDGVQIDDTFPPATFNDTNGLGPIGLVANGDVFVTIQK